MMRKLALVLTCIGILLGNSIEAFNQSTVVKGHVFDAETNEPLSYVEITFSGTTVGTISDIDGSFTIETRLNVDSIKFRFIGYQTVTRPIIKRSSQTLQIKMAPQAISLDAIVIKPTENPAHPILRNIIANKDRNSGKWINAWSCEVYNKMSVSVSKIDRIKAWKFMQQYDFVFDNKDSSELTGKKFTPLLFSETLSDLYRERNPQTQKEIIKASRISGTQNQSLAAFTGRLHQELDLYDNTIRIFDDGFVSPIADFGLTYYKYYLVDSAYIDSFWCYKLEFTPKRKQERTFNGYFWVVDSVWALKSIRMTMAQDANVNFLKNMHLEVDYQAVGESWMPQSEKIQTEFDVNKQLTGLFGRKSTVYSNYRLSTPIPEQMRKLAGSVYVPDSATKKDTSFWRTARPIDLSQNEEKIYETVDSVQKTRPYKIAKNGLNLLVNYYLVHGKFEWGPYYSFYSFNDVEGSRFRLGGRTSNAFSTKLMLEGHVAYGMRDEKFKYGIGGMYVFNKNLRRSVGISYINDMRQLGQSHNAFHSDNFLASLLQRAPNNKLTQMAQFTSYYEHEFNGGVMTKYSLNHSILYPSSNIELLSMSDSLPHKHLTTASIGLQARWAYKERILMGEFERVSLGSDYPIITAELWYSPKKIAGSEYEYFKTKLALQQRIPFLTLGYFKYQIEAGKIFGQVPYPLLELHYGNQTYAFDYFAFNMMNYYEFASDQWVSVFAEHHFQGLFLNRIPLLRKLKWREVISAKGVIGSISEQNKQLYYFPEGMSEVRKPYLEASVGIENIFKLLRVDLMWRMTHQYHTDEVSRMGIRAMLQFKF